MARRIGPEAKIIALFSALPDDSKRIVFDVMKTQVAKPRKVAAKEENAITDLLAKSLKGDSAKAATQK